MKFKFALALILAQGLAFAHFGVVLPSKSIVENQKDSQETITYKFSHPFEQNLMNMERPDSAGVFVDGKKINILQNLTEKKLDNLSFWEAKYEIKNPGIYQFFVDPKPYFEPAESKFIRHITKTIVDAYGFGEGWDEPIGLKTEIVPLTRPYGLYAGNIFTAKVLVDGKPLKNAIVEIEYLNSKALKAPSEDHITQEVKTNDNGEFSFVMPLSGWWGFAALSDDTNTIKKDGKDYPIELGAVIWVETMDYE